MASRPETEEPGFEHDVNELPEDRDGGSPDRLENALPEDEGALQLDEAQEQAAEERKAGGYQ